MADQPSGTADDIHAVRRPSSRSDRLRRDRRKKWSVIALAALCGSAAALASGPRSAPAAQDPDVTTASVPAGDDGFETLFLGHRATDGTLDLAVVFGVDRAQPGRGVVLLLPPPTMVQVPALQTQTLAELPAFVDDDILSLTVMNATGIRIDGSIIADDLLLAQLLAPADPIPVEFRRGVRIDDDAGTIGFPSGRHKIAAADAYRVLLGEEPDGALAHLVTVQAVLEGWLARLDSPKVARPTVALDERAKPLRTMGGTAPLFSTLPVERVDAGDDELFRLLDTEVADLVRDEFGRAALGHGERPRAELRNGTGTVGLTQRVSQFVVPIGVEVAFTDNVVGFGQATTTVIYYRDTDAGAARDVVDALGVGSIVQANREIDVVDLTVIVGADFETAHPEGR
jgi:hypothetical protein